MDGWGEGHIKGTHHWEAERGGLPWTPKPQSLCAKEISGVRALASLCSISHELGRCSREPLRVNLEHRQHGAINSPRQSLFSRPLSRGSRAEELKRQIETGRASRALGLMSYVQIPYIYTQECTLAQACGSSPKPRHTRHPHLAHTCHVLDPAAHIFISGCGDGAHHLL